MVSSPTQEAHSLSTFHWIFSEEMPAESIPQFFPRVLDFEQSSNQSSHGSPFQPGPRYRRDQTYQEYSSPIYDPNCSPCYYPDSPQWAPGPSSESLSSPQWAPGPSSESISRPTRQLSQAPDLPFESQGLKRHTESPREEDQRPRKYSRLSDSQSDSHVDSEQPDVSAAGTPPTTAAHSLHSSESQSSSSHACFDHIMEIQRLRAQLVISESRNARAMSDLAEARVCVDFLMNEVGRVMASTSQAHPAAERVRQIIRSNTELRVPLFTRASPEMTLLADPQQETLPVVDNADAAWSEDLDPRNPNSYYFSELPMAGPSTQTGPIPMAASSQLAPIGGFQSYGAMTSVGGEGSASYSEMVREASQGYIPREATSSITQAGRSEDPSGSQLVPDWSHTRVDSYLSHYYTEPLPPFDSAQETRGNYAPNYELSATRYS